MLKSIHKKVKGELISTRVIVANMQINMAHDLM